MTQTVTIGNGRLTATVAAKGAELQSLVPAGGADVMWSGDPAVWAWHAPNLFPIVGGLADDILLHDGHHRVQNADRSDTLRVTDTLLTRFQRDGIHPVTVDAWS